MSSLLTLATGYQSDQGLKATHISVGRTEYAAPSFLIPILITYPSGILISRVCHFAHRESRSLVTNSIHQIYAVYNRKKTLLVGMALLVTAECVSVLLINFTALSRGKVTGDQLLCNLI